MGRATAVRVLNEAREQFAGVGTRAVKIRLNKLAKKDPYALALRKALEAEDQSSQAKKYGRSWRDTCYGRKHALVHELMDICEQQSWVYGYHRSEGWLRFIVYFELPGVEQISFHMPGLDREAPPYAKPWDGKEHSTIAKLETAIRALLSNGNQAPAMPPPVELFEAKTGRYARLRWKVANLEAGDTVIISRYVDQYRDPLVEIEYRGRRAWCHLSDLDEEENG